MWPFAGLLPLLHFIFLTGHKLITSLPVIVLSAGGATIIFYNIVAILLHQQEVTFLSGYYTVLVMSFLNSMVLSELYAYHDVIKSLFQTVLFVVFFGLSFFSPFILFCTNPWSTVFLTDSPTYINWLLLTSYKVTRDLCQSCAVLSYVMYYIPVFLLLATLVHKNVKAASKIGNI